ncbi:aminodeoxychorismate synthase component I [Rhizomonospora bruguierae]|uniref:aminodeoxychorismate synthase component I n=1 Tax=Rhizomonospora bruguierae TaxID=1581705 RepID=UPI001BD05D61|nr:aminodeoxychorismate synthase component I [Micromonospora sp. NBRC 107566]
MRTLVVDNYDSFTYNLVHLLAGVAGREPVVVRNDDPMPDLAGYDAIVLSPGPGTPERPADFGICRALAESSDLPLLGVCLGHQGLAWAHGGAIGPAPEPRHGRVSPVLHDGRELFAGIPSPFRAVRYHSLAVTAVPPAMEATAYTPDGVVMGLRHHTRPRWGVQFHPESIGTEHGQRLIRNFVSLAERAARPGPITVTPPTPPPPTVPAAEPAYRVLHAALPTRWSDELVYDRLFRRSMNAVWLDSSQTGGESGRFSVMADDSGPLARTAYADAWTGTVRVESAAGVTETRGPFLDWLDADLRAHAVAPPPVPCDFALGWLGYLGYELKAECGGDRAHRSAEPDAALLFTDRAVVLDHATGTTYLLALARTGSEADARAGQGAGPGPGQKVEARAGQEADAHAGQEAGARGRQEAGTRAGQEAGAEQEVGARAGREAGAREWLAATAERLRELAGQELPGPRWHPPGVAPSLRHDRTGYLAMIEKSRALIAAGETYEVCLTNAATAPVRLDTWAAYRTLRRFSPAPHAALLRFGALAVLSSSPERFLRVYPDGTVESRPIKGTRPRGAGEAADELLRKDLVASEKDRAENLMIVDLVRNDLGRVATVGSVRVPRLFEVETYATVHQLVSTVRAALRPGATAVDCVRAAFPGGSMTGAPKVRTMAIIDALEGAARGVYSGAIGYFSLTGAADLSIAIRTLVAAPGGVRYGTGGAIVALSEPAAEYEETAVKAAPLLRLLGAEFPDRTTTAGPGPAGPGPEPAGPELAEPEPEPAGPASVWQGG